MEKKILLKELVDAGTNIRREFIPKAVVSTNGKHQIGEFWDANKTIDVIVNNSHEQHDNIRELDEYTHSQVQRLDNVKVGRISAQDVLNLTESQINSLKVGDTIMKQENGSGHSYTVAYKSDSEMSVVYTDHETVEEVYYEKVNGVWTYIQTDTFKPEDYYTKTLVDNKLDDILGVNADDIAAIKSLVDDLDDTTGLLSEINSKQETLVSGENIKTISGNSILGSGNIDIQATVTANEPMPASWLNGTETMTQLINKINADENVQKGKIYLSTVSLNDLPTGVHQAEMKVEIMGKQSGKFIMVFSISSANISPYKWEYTSYNEQNGPWRSWVASNTALFSGDYEDLQNKPTIPTVPIKFISTSNITALTTEQCESLSAGDVVIKETNNMKHTYVVSYKEDGVGMCLTYTDASTSETVSYDFDGTDWVYNSTDITSFDSIISRIEALENIVNPQV